MADKVVASALIALRQRISAVSLKLARAEPTLVAGTSSLTTLHLSIHIIYRKGIIHYYNPQYSIGSLPFLYEIIIYLTIMVSLPGLICRQIFY